MNKDRLIIYQIKGNSTKVAKMHMTSQLCKLAGHMTSAHLMQLVHKKDQNIKFWISLLKKFFSFCKLSVMLNLIQMVKPSSFQIYIICVIQTNITPMAEERKKVITERNYFIFKILHNRHQLRSSLQTVITFNKHFRIRKKGAGGIYMALNIISLLEKLIPANRPLILLVNKRVKVTVLGVRRSIIGN